MIGQSQEWVDCMRREPVLEVAKALGRRTKPARNSDGGQVYGCPACNAERRHTKSADPRGAVGLRPGGLGWRCFQCDAGGDTLDFIAYALRGNRYPEIGDAGKPEVRDWCKRWLGLDTTANPIQRNAMQPAAPPTPVERPYPPADEVAAFWNACGRVDQDERVSSWLRDARGIDPSLVADFALARVAPDEGLPHWAGTRSGSWPSKGLRLVVPLYDAHGVMRSVLFRLSTADAWTRGGDPPPKSASASGRRTGLMMACPIALQVLRDRKWPDSWPVEAQRVLVAEGETDFLTYVLEGASHVTPSAVLAGVAGSWQLLAALPKGSQLVVQTHADSDGCKYADKIIEAVLPRWQARELTVRLPSYFAMVGGKVELR